MWYRVRFKYTIYADLLVRFSFLYYSLIVYINAALEINIYIKTNNSIIQIYVIERGNEISRLLEMKSPKFCVSYNYQNCISFHFSQLSNMWHDTF